MVALPQTFVYDSDENVLIPQRVDAKRAGGTPPAE